MFGKRERTELDRISYFVVVFIICSCLCTGHVYLNQQCRLKQEHTSHGKGVCEMAYYRA